MIPVCTNPADFGPAPRAQDVQAVRLAAPPLVRAMIDMQRLAAMPAAELCAMRPDDLDAAPAGVPAGVWVYAVPWHVESGGGRIPLGPPSQKILQPLLDTAAPGRPLFPDLDEYRRQVHEACRRAGVRPFDLEWLRGEGGEPHPTVSGGYAELPAAVAPVELLGGKSGDGPPPGPRPWWFAPGMN